MLNLLFKKEKPYSALIKKYAAKYSLDPEIVAAVILQESSGNQYAYREEPGFYQRYLVAKDLSEPRDEGIATESERRFRSFSFGLMQIMGQTARENGFTGYLPELYDAETNIALGCKILAKNLWIFKGDLMKALSAYNSGVGYVKQNGITPYASKVMARTYNNEFKKIL